MRSRHIWPTTYTITTHPLYFVITDKNEDLPFPQHGSL